MSQTKQERLDCVKHHWKSWTTHTSESGDKVVVCPSCITIVRREGVR